jgi:general stress protein YciG
MGNLPPWPQEDMVMGEQSTRRGFAGMSDAKQRAIASKGGRAAHLSGKAHEFDAAEARIAGRKGGLAVSRDRAHMAEIGRHGGQARGHQGHTDDAIPLAQIPRPDAN